MRCRSASRRSENSSAGCSRLKSLPGFRSIFLRIAGSQCHARRHRDLVCCRAGVECWAYGAAVDPAAGDRGGGSRRARPAAALEDTKGWALRIFAIFFVAVIPWLAVDLAVFALIGRGIIVTGSIAGMIGLVFGAILQTVLLTLIAVIASLLFIALGAHERRHARPSAPA